MSKLFWLRILILLSVTACLVSDTIALGHIHLGGKNHGKVSDILRHIYSVVRKQEMEQTFQIPVAKQ